ncbi:UNVERIFIED_CONTAM: hypothetical protein GTU68_014976 [Idotea baltica]|nr:hypothetical protein [Idotea baltica]
METRLIFVTGVAGAGKTSALAALADQGFETIDNPPINLLDSIVDEYAGEGARLALGVDERSRGFTTERCANAVASLRSREDMNVTLLFLECSDEMLLRRFQETRRRHPMAEGAPVESALVLERAMLEPMRIQADVSIDTSDLSLTDLRREIGERFGNEGAGGMTVSIISFGFKKGAPRGADLLFDMRFLANPYWLAPLREKTGMDPEVRAYIESDPNFEGLFEKMEDLVLSLLPHYAREGKSYLNIAIGCTGGKHRSVMVAEKLAASIGKEGFGPVIRHRDMPIAARSRTTASAL